MMNGQAIAMPSAVDRPDGDAAARVGTLFDAHHRRLLTLARRLCSAPEDARDVVQDTFLRAARSPGSIPAGAPNEEACRRRHVAPQGGQGAHRAADGDSTASLKNAAELQMANAQ
jgi:hypothetical protein